MKKIVCVGCVLCLICCSSYRSEAQNTSNKGKDFWLGYGNHIQGYLTNTQQMAVYITSDVNAQGTLQIPGIAYSTTFTVTANTITIMDIPQAAYLPGGNGATGPNNNNGNGKYNLGIHITSDKDIVVYAHIYFASVSGATLVLPTPTLGKDYISINYTQVSNQQDSFSYFFIVAVEDSTEVDITPSVDTQASNTGQAGWLAKTTHHVSLKKGEIYQVLGKYLNTIGGNTFLGNDLTGSIIHSVSTSSVPCKRIAVFSGSGKIAIGCSSGGAGTSDNLYQQVYPTAAWGKKFVTAPLKSRNYDAFRIVKSDPTANVTLNGNPIPNSSFINSLYYDFDSQAPNVIDSDKPIQVVQYAVTQGKSINCGSNNEPYGDPEMIYLNPIEQTLTKITMYSTDRYKIIVHFVNVIILTKDAPGFKIDNVSHATDFKPVPGLPEYSYAQISVTQGTHTLLADGGFNAIAYGFGTAESYGYAAGANFKSLSLEGQSKVSHQFVSGGCINEVFNFRITLSYVTSKLSWNLGDGSTAIDVINPAPDSTFLENGKTYNVYKLKKDISYNAAKDYTIEVTAQNNSGECGTTEVIDLTFTIFGPPVAKFSVATEVCSNVQTQFTDQSDGAGRTITNWNWDFGDHTFSTLQSPKHTYSASGSYIVTLTITNGSSCGPISSSQPIKILKLPVAGFSQQAVSCAPPVARFTDSSTSADGTIIKWMWDYGDGITENRTSAVIFDHTYPSSGTYTVKLIVQTDKGCLSDTLKRAINVSPSPLVDFVLPEVCLTDPFAQFTDQSTISDGSEAQFSYLWDFGDQKTSALKNPQHKYISTGTYKVSLTITSNNGCSTTLSKQFTVNGSFPKADFVVQNVNNLCSNQQVTFINKSSVDFGSITRLVWYFDLSDLTNNLPDDNPVPDKIYTHLYPLSATNMNYNVKLQVYSGGICVTENPMTITVQAVPQVLFSSLSPVCKGQSPFQITQASETHGFTGSGKFSGPGVSSTGLFSPGIAGAGTFTIKYLFTATNGCADSTTQQITVFSTPTVNAGKDTVILEGGQTKLKAIATGSNLTYKWSPSIGLDHDDIANPLATPSNDITYTLTVTSDQGCSAADAIFVKVLKSPEIPNTFTPNSDGINDTWVIKYLNSYPGCTINIFNRYGVKIYSSVGYPEAWDGKINGNDLPVGTYYYIVDPKNGRKMFSGSVTILR